VGKYFRWIGKAAVNGMYVRYFLDLQKNKEYYSKRLRAVMQALLTDFANDMRRNEA